jgi:hypothetical protein
VLIRGGLAACAVSLIVASSSLAAPAADPDAVRLASALKRSMQASYKTAVPGLVFRRVTCTLTANMRSGRCRAGFSYPPREFDGVYQITASINAKTGGVRWRATSVACTSTRTGKKIPC